MTYHFVYKTKHINGRFYLGRHTTENLDDGYLGSGVWVAGIKDRSSLSRDILEFVDSSEKLKLLEEEYIDLHWDDPDCMNRGKGSAGWTTEELSAENKRRVSEGTHNFLGGDIPRENQRRRVAEGVHQWIGDKNPTHDRIREGSHLWLSEEHKQATAENFERRMSSGEHHFLQKVQCPYCHVNGQMTAMKRWHFDNYGHKK